MKSEIVYLDTNIFIHFFLERSGFEKIKKFFENYKESFDFVSSDWTLTEVVKVLINEYKTDPKKVISFIEKLQRERRIFGEKFSFIETSEDKKYDFKEFFYHLQKIIITYGNGVPDSIHSLIMDNNNIKYILTTDKGFEGIEGIIVINPLGKNENKK